MSRTTRPRLLRGALSLTCGAALVTATFTVPAALGTESLPDLVREADESVSVVEIVVADTGELDRLVDTGADLDHATPWPKGESTPTNLSGLCRHHHLLKHSPRWTHRLHADGTT